jgi:nucleotidyltransferase substrate binding protein (TIGR01987 family)
MSKNPDVRWQQRLQSFRKAFGRLSEATVLANERELSQLERQGLIQAFEFTHELAWKTLKDFLESRGSDKIFGSKDATRQGFANGLVADGEVWMDMIKSRNQTSHTYNEDTARQISEAVTERYVHAFEKFLRQFTELEADEP